jgi:hypothetical protein
MTADATIPIGTKRCMKNEVLGNFAPGNGQVAEVNDFAGCSEV